MPRLLLGTTLGASLLAGCQSFRAPDDAFGAPMQFVRVGPSCDGMVAGCEAYVLGSGRIEWDTAERFSLATAAAPGVRTVVLASRGGNLFGGMRLGREIRRAGFDTEVGPRALSEVEAPSQRGFRAPVDTRSGRIAGAARSTGCYSSCVYAFMGGVGRRLEAPGELGVNQLTAERGATVDAAKTQSAVAELRSYTAEMGVERSVVDVASRIPHDAAFVFSPAEVRRYNLANADPALAKWSLQGPDDRPLRLRTLQRVAHRDDEVDIALGAKGAALAMTIEYLPAAPHRKRRTDPFAEQLRSASMTLRIDGVAHPVAVTRAWTPSSADTYLCEATLAPESVAALARASAVAFEIRAAAQYVSVTPPDVAIDITAPIAVEGLPGGLRVLAAASTAKAGGDTSVSAEASTSTRASTGR